MVSAVPQVSRILIVDDHAIFNKGLALLLNAEANMEVCGAATCSAEALEMLRALEPDLAILDISIRTESGLELLKSMKARVPGLVLMILSFHSEPKYIVRALALGATGYMGKAEQPKAIVAAVRAVLAGKVRVSAQFGKLAVFDAIRGFQENERLPADRLTNREAEIFALLGGGLGVEEICRALTFSDKTFETHRRHIKGKFDCVTAVELQQFALHWMCFQNGLAEGFRVDEAG